MPRRCRLGRGPVVLGLILLLALSGPLLAGQNSRRNFNMQSSEGGAAGSGNADIWLEIHQEINLDGLWGSIDTEQDIDPFVVEDVSEGVVHLLWAEWDGSHYRAVHAWRPSGEAWSGPEPLEADGGAVADSVTPRGVIGSDGLLHVAWTRVAGGMSSVYHAARFPLGWTLPELLSGFEIAFQPFARVAGNKTLVDYQTYLEMVTVEVTILGQSGGSDDIDPTTVEVESTEVGREFLPR